MKKLAMLVVVGALAAVAAASNPREGDFIDWFDQRIEAATGDAKGLEALFAFGIATVTKVSAQRTVVRRNYVLFSVFEIELLGRKHEFIGAFGHFAPREDGQ